MVTKEELQKKYINLSNHELLNIIENKFDYTDLAVSVALSELSKRNINEDDIKEYKESIEKEIETFIERNIVDDLSIIQKLLFFIFWVPLLNFPFRQNFSDEGYELKLKQANYYSWAGFISLILISLATVSYNLSELTTFLIWLVCFLPAFLFDENFNRNRQIKKLERIFGKAD